jgi:hypothetical protein
MAETKFIAGLFFFFFIEFSLFSLYAAHNVAVSCPEINISQTDAITSLINGIGVIFSPCSGLPAWIYLIIFTPLALALIIELTPFI